MGVSEFAPLWLKLAHCELRRSFAETKSFRKGTPLNAGKQADEIGAGVSASWFAAINSIPHPAFLPSAAMPAAPASAANPLCVLEYI